MESDMTDLSKLPVAIIGAGPIGLAAAAHLIERGIAVKVYEAGDTIGANIRDWSHVRIFTTWEQSVDPASCRLLARHGWTLPSPQRLPTGGELYAQYLRPLAETPELAPHIETAARVIAVSRQGIDKVVSKGRETRPFRLEIATRDGRPRIDLARAVLDASGTWSNQNPLGASGLPAVGETQHRDRIAYGLPDVLDRDRALYAGKRVAVIGSGYSAINVLLDLARLAQDDNAAELTWILRGRDLGRIYGGGSADQLPARGDLGGRLRQLVDAGRITLVTGFSATAVTAGSDGLLLAGEIAGDERQIGPLDRLIVATGQRPDLDLTRELRLDLDPWLESVRALGPLIDPNLHACGSVPPHGHRQLAHPEPDFYTIGVKSYGRAPTFLLLTGYEQARSVAAMLAGDQAAADDVQLVLPETGICLDVATESDGGCCGGPVKTVAAAACCVADDRAKSAGLTGCGCGAPT
jgi:NADPH-dependent 2,4-dienoyl-CoA reductase/sulfur reductase-like enzyme